MVSELTRHRREFWRHFSETLPALHGRMIRGNEHSGWLIVGRRPLVVAHYVANGGVGLFVRGPAGEKVWRTREYLFPHRAYLAEAFGNPALKLGTMFLLATGVRLDMTDKANWPRATNWFGEHSPHYEKALFELQLGSRPDAPAWPDPFQEEHGEDRT